MLSRYSASDRFSTKIPRFQPFHPPQIPHAFPSVGPQYRPRFVVPKCLQEPLWRTLLDVLSQYSPPVASADGGYFHISRKYRYRARVMQ